MSGKFISYEAAAREIDPDNPPHKKSMKRWPGFPKAVKPSGKPNGREWLIRSEFNAWQAEQVKRRGAS
jgi:hypothetical protein